MHRFWKMMAAAAVVWAMGTQAALGQEPVAPAAPLAPAAGFYLSVWKLLLGWFVVLCWVRTSDWVNQDAIRNKIGYSQWNPIVVFSFLFAFFVFLLLPWYIAGLPMLILAWFVPLITYVSQRDKKVEAHKRVLTNQGMRNMMAGPLGMIGIKIKTRIEEGDKGPPVKLVPKGGATDRDNSVNLLTARQSPGFLGTRELLADAVSYEADAVMLDFTPEMVGVRYQIDGVWHEREAQDRESGDALLSVLKTISARDAAERRKKQEGAFGAEVNGKTLNCKLVTQGVETGERAMVLFEQKKSPFNTLDDIGMRTKMQEQLREAIGQKQGVVLLASPPAQGLSTTFEITLRAMDRFIRDYAAIEDAGKREREVENVAVTTYNGAAGESPATILPKLVRTYPGAFVVRDPVNAETMAILLKQVGEERMVVIGTRAKECAEALLRVLQLKVPAKDFAPAATAVLTQRLIRKLCESCKEAFPPTPEMCRQLGIPPGKVEFLYREPTEVEEGKVCPACQGIGYRGRTAIFEFMPVDDQVRETLIKAPKLENLRAAGRKAGMRTMQEEGLVLVVKGVTSLPELARVLKS